MKTALAHHWYFQPRGGERVIAEIAKIFPDAPILTSFATSKTTNWPKEISELKERIIPSNLQFFYNSFFQTELSLPFLLLLMPYFLQNSFKKELKNVDRLIVNEAGLAKIIASEQIAKNFVYIHSPMRYIWDDYTINSKKYLAKFNAITNSILIYLRHQDLEASRRVNYWAANSKSTALKVCETYKLDIEKFKIIYPPVNLGSDINKKNIRKGLLVVSSMQPYKRDDLAIKAAVKLKLPLTVIGEGPLRRELEKLAGSNVKFTGFLPDSKCRILMEESEALVYCGKEDFGITPVEAMSRGCPVLAFGEGGALETVTNNVSGLFFFKQELDDVIEGINKIKSTKWDEFEVRNSVLKFSQENFNKVFLDWVNA